MPLVSDSQRSQRAALLLKGLVVSTATLALALLITAKPTTLTTTVKPVLETAQQQIQSTAATAIEQTNYAELTSSIDALGKNLIPDQTPNDAFAHQQWSLQNNPDIAGSSSLFGSYSYLTGSQEIVVAVVDSGVILNHEDLNFLPGYDFIHNPIVGNDGDGRDHDPSDPGDWVKSEDIEQQIVGAGCVIADSKWHGTAIAGIIGATAYNAVGIAGGSPSVSMLPVRVTGKCGGYVTDLIDGIRWAAGLSVNGVANNPHPAHVINLSIGFPGACSNALQQAIDDATDAGSVLVTASTNSAADLDREPYSPASCSNILTVAAIDRAGDVTAYSALGQSVFISAPGGTASDGIITTQNDGPELPLQGNYYGYHYGTSIAAAHVSSTVANMLSFDPALNQTEIRQVLSASASTNHSDPRCESAQCGVGRLNAVAAMQLLTSDYLQDNTTAFQTDTPVADFTAATVQLAAANADQQTVVTTNTNESIQAGSIDWQSLLLLALLLSLSRNHLKRRA